MGMLCEIVIQSVNSFILAGGDACGKHKRNTSHTSNKGGCRLGFIQSGT